MPCTGVDRAKVRVQVTFFAVMALLSLLMAAAAARQVLAADRAEKGVEVAAVVVGYRGGCTSESSMCPDVTLRYTVDGRVYTKRVWTGSAHDGRALEVLMGSPQEAVGRTVPIRVEREEPTNIMVPGVPLNSSGWPTFAGFLGGSALCSLGVYRALRPLGT